jgi:hypothetical protein
VPERVREKRLPDADGAEHDHVAVSLDEPQRRQLGENATVVVNPRGLGPALDHHVGIEPGVLGAPLSGGALTARDVRLHQLESSSSTFQTVRFLGVRKIGGGLGESA